MLGDGERDALERARARAAVAQLGAEPRVAAQRRRASRRARRGSSAAGRRWRAPRAGRAPSPRGRVSSSWIGKRLIGLSWRVPRRDGGAEGGPCPELPASERLLFGKCQARARRPVAGASCGTAAGAVAASSVRGGRDQHEHEPEQRGPAGDAVRARRRGVASAPVGAPPARRRAGAPRRADTGRPVICTVAARGGGSTGAVVTGAGASASYGLAAELRSVSRRSSTSAHQARASGCDMGSSFVGLRG